MTTVGDAEDYWAHTFPDDLVPEILAMVLAAWDTFLKPQPDAGEVETTARFRKQLLQTSELRKLPLRIDPETSIYDPTTNEVIGRLDLRLTTPRRVRDDVYFAFECKRLYASTPRGKRPKALADAYVLQGMTRFVMEQYAESVAHGGMIAYVLNGTIGRAIRQVGKNIRAHHDVLRLLPPGELLPSPVISDDRGRLVTDDRVLLTQHDLDRGLFLLHQVFLAR